jgi:hypothetical protein
MKESEKQEDTTQMLLLETNPNDDSILETVTLAGIDTAIKETQHVLDVTTVLMVSFARKILVKMILFVYFQNDSEMEQRFRYLEQKSKAELMEEQELSSENFRYSCSLHSESGQPWTDAKISHESRRK